MKVVTFEHKGDFNKTTKFLNAVSNGKYLEGKLHRFGQMGVEALSAATPVDTGKTAQSWNYDLTIKGDSVVITWNNTNVNKYANIAVLVDTGHATGNGGYVSGYHYIEPAINPIFKQIIDEVWKEVTSK